jgi:hypothetical protein
MIFKYLYRNISLWIAILALTALATPARAVDLGQPLSDFSLQGIDGRTYVASDYRGKVLVLYLMGYA